MVAQTEKRCFLIVFLLTTVALGHKGEVHDLIARDAIDVASDLGIQFGPEDIERFADGSVDEDVYHSEEVFPRFAAHHYNPHTGSGMVFVLDFATAKARASGMWTDEVLPSFTDPSNRSAGDGQGSFHYLGRVSHLLQDMAAPPHTHAPKGHGPDPLWPLPNIDPWYSDFEEYWRSNLSLFPHVEGSDTALLPSSGIPVNRTWNTKMDSYSWSEMRTRIGTQEDSIEGFMDTVAWITYFHSSFYGEFEDSTSDAAPPTTSQGSGADNTNTLDTMFGNRIKYSGGLLEDDYWVIDGIGWYDKFDLSFNDWWPCDDDTVGSVFSGRITGRFYIYQTWGNSDAPSGDGLSCYPDAWPNGEINSSNKVYARYYGDVLHPLVARYNAGLLQKAFPSPTAITYPSSSPTGQHAVSWEVPPDSVAGSAEGYYVLQRSDDGGNIWSTVYDQTILPIFSGHFLR